MESRESLREIAIGKFYLKKSNEVGFTDISKSELEAYEAGFFDCYDRFFIIQGTVKLPLYNVDSANFKLPESRL